MLSQHYERHLINKPHTQSQSPNIAIGPNADIGLDLSGSSKPKTPSVSGKGKREARRTTVSKDFSSNTPQTAFSQAQEGFRVLPRSCAQSTRDGKPIKGSDGGSKLRINSQACHGQRWALNLEGVAVEVLEEVLAEFQASPP